jgi:hypothetical protein
VCVEHFAGEVEALYAVGPADAGADNG